MAGEKQFPASSISQAFRLGTGLGCFAPNQKMNHLRDENLSISKYALGRHA